VCTTPCDRLAIQVLLSLFKPRVLVAQMQSSMNRGHLDRGVANVKVVAVRAWLGWHWACWMVFCQVALCHIETRAATVVEGFKSKI